MTTRTTSHRRSVPMRSKRKWKLKLRVWLGDSTSPRGKGESRSFFFSTRGDADREFLEKLLGVRLNSFQKKKTWPQTYPIYFRVVR